MHHFQQSKKFLLWEELSLPLFNNASCDIFLFFAQNKNSSEISVHRLSGQSPPSSMAQRVILKARLGLPSFGVTSQPLL